MLARAGVPARFMEHLVQLGRGHPLTLALLADAALAGSVPENLADAPDLVATLAELVVDVAPDDAHALGLALCAHAFVTTGDLLRDAVGERAGEVWQWLEARPFVSRGVNGLYPHDLVRDGHRRREIATALVAQHRGLELAQPVFPVPRLEQRFRELTPR